MLKFLQNVIFFGKKWVVFIETPEVDNWQAGYTLMDEYWSKVNGTVNVIIFRNDTIKNEYYNGHEVITEYTFKPVFGLKVVGWDYGFKEPTIPMLKSEHKIVWSLSGYQFFKPLLYLNLKRKLTQRKIKTDEFPF